MAKRQPLNKMRQKEPYNMVLRPNPEGVILSIALNNTFIPHEVLTTDIKLPDWLRRFFYQQGNIGLGHYLLSLPMALWLATELVKNPVAALHLNATAITALQTIAPPPDFHVRWVFDHKTQVLKRQLHLGEGYLGEGWVLGGQQVWRIAPDLTPDMLHWLNQPQISAADLFSFCVAFENLFDGPRYRCDLQLEYDFKIKLNVIKTLKESMDIQLVSSKPDIAARLKTIKGDKAHLISGTTILPHWGTLLRGPLLDLARSGEVQRIAGNDLYALIQDDLLPNAESLGIDVAMLRGTYPVVDASHLRLIWNVEYGTKNGTGYYEVAPQLVMGSDEVFLSRIESRVKDGQRFYRVNDVVLELTPAFVKWLSAQKQQGITAIQLTISEIMGTRRERLDRFGLQPPSIEFPTEGDDETLALHRLQILRGHGLPAGFSGLQDSASDILANACRQLLDDHPEAKILWLATRRKTDNAINALKKAGVQYQGHVWVESPDSDFPTYFWDAIIFQDIELISSGKRQQKTLAALRRHWSISTFNRDNWHTDALVAPRVLSILGIPDSDRLAFTRICVGDYEKQATGILGALINPFKKLTFGIETEREGLPIPLRPTPPPIPTSGQMATGFRGPMRGDFYYDALQLESHTEKSAEHVPFVRYWPTYSAMDMSQQKWYFYWRGQVRQGNYPPTDLSYIYLHIYEALHLIGFEGSQAAFDHLVNLWLNYRTQHPKLDSQLVDWLADFIVVNELPQTTFEWYSRAIELGAQPSDNAISMMTWTRNDINFLDAPDQLIEIISDYKYKSSKFYLAHNTNNAVEQQIRHALHLINTHVMAHEGQSLLKRYQPTSNKIIKRLPFEGALYEGRRNDFVSIEVPDWANLDELRATITAIIKYTENRLRRQHNFRGTLRGFTIPDEWSKILNEAFPVVEESRETAEITPPVAVETPLVIDYSKVQALIEESNIVRDRLSVSEATETIGPPTDEPVPAINTTIERPANTPVHQLTELPAVAAIIASDTTADSLLRALQANDWTLAEAQAQALMQGQFLNVVLDRINEPAVETLGDQLIFIEGTALMVNEDYQDEIAYVLTHQDKSLQPEPPKQTQYSDIVPEWVSFIEQMQPQHWKALRALLEGEDVNERLNSVARSVYSTANLLIDEINEFALTCFGDIVIDATNMPPTIDPDDLEHMRLLMTWALQHLSLEE